MKTNQEAAQNSTTTETPAEQVAIFKQDDAAAQAAISKENEVVTEEKPKAEAAAATEEKKPDEKTGQKEAKPDDKAAEGDSAQKPKAPESYDLKLTDDTALKSDAIERISQEAKEKGLTNDEAQALLDREDAAIKRHIDDQMSLMAERTQAWEGEIKADKEIGGEKFAESVALSSRVIEKYAPDELKTELEKTGLANYPPLVKFIARIGRASGSDTFVSGGQPLKKEKTREEKFYGSSAE